MAKNYFNRYVWLIDTIAADIAQMHKNFGL